MIRCKFSKYYLDGSFRNSAAKRAIASNKIGVIVRESTDKKQWLVKWDGRKTPFLVAKFLIEIIF